MDVDTLKDEIQKYDVNENTWKDNMLMVTKLLKSHGVKLGDLDNTRKDLDAIYPYIAEILSEMVEPNITEYYAYETLEKMVSATKNSEAMKEMIKNMFSSKESVDNNPRNTSSTASKIYSELAMPIVMDISHTQRLVKNFSTFLISKYGAGALARLDSIKSQGTTEITQDIYDFYIEQPEYNKDLEEIFKSNATAYYKDMSKFIKNGLINRISTIVNFFEECGYLEKIVDIHNKSMKKIGLDFLGVTTSDDREKFNMLNLTSTEYLAKLDTSELFVLSAFYTNRLEKVIERLSDGVYLQMKLGTLYETLERGEIPGGIDSRDVRTILKQKKFLDMLSKPEFEKFKNKVKDGAMPKEEDFTYVPEEYIQMYSKAYKEYFDRYIPKEDNDFTADYQCTFLNRTHSYIIYFLKDFSIESLLYTLNKNNSKVNYGLVPERSKKVNEYGEEQVLIGVDMKEFWTMMAHFPNSSFNSFLNESLDNKDFRKYIGNEDFDFRDEHIKTYVLFKLTKTQKQKVKKLYETMDKDDPRYALISHIYFNIHPAQNPLNSKKKNKDENSR